MEQNRAKKVEKNLDGDGFLHEIRAGEGYLSQSSNRLTRAKSYGFCFSSDNASVPRSASPRLAFFQSEVLGLALRLAAILAWVGVGVSVILSLRQKDKLGGIFFERNRLK